MSILSLANLSCILHFLKTCDTETNRAQNENTDTGDGKYDSHKGMACNLYISCSNTNVANTLFQQIFVINADNAEVTVLITKLNKIINQMRGIGTFICNRRSLEYFVEVCAGTIQLPNSSRFK